MKHRTVACLSVFVWLLCASLAFGAVDLPDELKAVVPIYPGAEVVFSTTMSNAYQAVIETTASAEDVFNYYKDEMKGRGWKVEMEMSQKDASMLHLSKGSDKLTITVHPEDEKTQVHFVLAKE